MSFWGIEVKPGKPYTHSSQSGRTRLRISQATLANGSATLKSLVQCNVGDKQPVLLCALLPTKIESLQLDLEFEEAEDVVFSVIGPRGVYLTGYYVGHNRQSNIQDESESYGEDIANSETQESNHNSDEDEYEDSFINDDEPEPVTPSPVSSSRDDDEGEYLKNKRNGNGGRKRLKKKYQVIESDDEMGVQEIEDEDDFPISSICKNKKSQVSEEKTEKETKGELDRVTKTNDDKSKSDGVHSGVLDSKDKVNVHLIDDKTKGKGDQPNMSLPSLVEVVPEGISKPKKKKQESTKEERATGPTSVDQPSVQVPLVEVKTKKKKKENTKKGNANKAEDEDHADPLKDKIHQFKVESNSINHDVLAAKDDKKPNDTSGVDHSFEVLASAEIVPEKNSKPKKKRKGRSEVSTDGTDGNLLAGNKQEDDQQAVDKSSGIDSKQLSNGIQSAEKKVKKKRRKTSKTQEVEENTNMEVEKENKPSATEPEGKDEESESCNKKTLSNGLVIEELATGKSKGKVAALGRKVKVQYVVKLKENGQVIDSNGKSPRKFRLGDKEVMEGLNVGLDGMRVGDKRRLTIPPSMSSGYKGTGENVPPNSLLVYDVELPRLHFRFTHTRRGTRGDQTLKLTTMASMTSSSPTIYSSNYHKGRVNGIKTRINWFISSSKSNNSEDQQQPTRREVILKSSELAVLGAIFHFSGNKPNYLGVQKNPPALALCPATNNCISTSENISDNLHYAPPWNYNPKEGRGSKKPMSKEVAMEELLEVINSTKPDNFTPRITEKKDDYIRVEYESPILGFVDDVEFWFPPGKKPLVQYRSASRIGIGFDANRKRVKALRLALEKKGWASEDDF
ncbi:hypothetical protein L6452_20128 [Arctium lappa]|uniref:Uncharacterized protein n=1 Tax=Arctium lappa TaxID=4217 RepID=A0ACB9BAX0_ARCLA|nr:hypothetical protein L6452_20128 [Arctium lappa]